MFVKHLFSQTLSAFLKSPPRKIRMWEYLPTGSMVVFYQFLFLNVMHLIVKSRLAQTASDMIDSPMLVLVFDRFL